MQNMLNFLYRGIFIYLCILALMTHAVVFKPSLKNRIQKSDKLFSIYLDPEIVHRINTEQIHTIVNIDSDQGLNAIQLNQHYKCPVFIVERDSHRLEFINKNIAQYSQVKTVSTPTDAMQLNALMLKNGITTIDLLCIDMQPEDLKIFLENQVNGIENIKYIILSNETCSPEIKDYFKKRGFRSFFDGFGLFPSVLFVNQRINNLDIDTIKTQVQTFNTPVLTPRIPGNLNSDLLYAASENNHAPFDGLTANNPIDINFQDAHGNSALIMAAANDSHYPLRKLMQRNDLNFNRKNNNGCTALMAAAAAGHAPLVNIMLEDPRAIATIDSVNNMGMKAEEIARLLRFSEIADLIRLKKHGNSASQSTKEEEYPRQIIPQKVLICGICRNVASCLPHTIKIMEQMGGLFEDYRVVVYENNSTDGTQDILKEWMTRNSKVFAELENVTLSHLSSEIINITDNGELFRIELIARARNILLDKVMSAEYETFPYVIIMDMDFAAPPSYESIVEVFQSNREWDAVFAYGSDKFNSYWDWYAFRDFNQPLGPELLGYDWFSKKRWSLNKTDQWCPVYSAFGGCGIYKRESIRGCRYSGIVTKEMEEIFKTIVAAGKSCDHPVILKYFTDVQKLHSQVNIFSPSKNLSRIDDKNVGIALQDEKDALIWRMNSFVSQYPAVCEHVPFHASMILNGHGKFFINPRLIFKYER